MDEKEKLAIARLVENALCLAKLDPQSFWIVKSNIDILKTRADMGKEPPELEAGPGKPLPPGWNANNKRKQYCADIQTSHMDENLYYRG